MINKILFLIFLFISSNAFARTSLVIDASNIYTNINDDQYHYNNEYEQIGKKPDYSLGLYSNYSNISYGFSTNRLSNNQSNRRVINKQGVGFNLFSNIIVDSLSVGYLFGRFNPSLFISRADVEKELFFKGRSLGNERDIVLLYGVNVGYFLTKNINLGLLFIAPNETLNLEFGSGVSIKYFF